MSRNFRPFKPKRHQATVEAECVGGSLDGTRFRGQISIDAFLFSESSMEYIRTYPTKRTKAGREIFAPLNLTYAKCGV
jgi:hypothetical protein